MSRLTSTAVVVLLSAGAAYGWPTPQNLYVPEFPGHTIELVPGLYFDIQGSERELNLPAGTAVITWSLTARMDPMNASLRPVRVRPVIGTSFPTKGLVMPFQEDAAGTDNGQASASGTWVTTVPAGLNTVKLQVGDLDSGTATLLMNQNQSVAWTITVFPDEPRVPAVGTVGLAVMVVVVIGAGAFVMKRRQAVEG